MARIGIFWPYTCSYVAAGMEALLEAKHEVTLFVEDDGQFDMAPLMGKGASLIRMQHQNWREVLDATIFHAVVVCGWHIKEFREAADRLKGQCPRILYFDTQWRGSLRQRVGQVVAPSLLHRRFEYCFVPGDRQGEFARRMGYREDRVLWGSLTCDQRFASVEPIADTGRLDRRNFLFVGRYAPEKGVDVLLTAYRSYRRAATDPWGLIMAGGSPSDVSKLAVASGVEHLGFLQPDSLMQAMHRAAVFVLPSRFEPYGVAIQEAALAGLPVITTGVCGAVPQVVDPGVSGRLVTPGDDSALSTAMSELAQLPPRELALMGGVGRSLASRFSPNRWAESILGTVQAM